MSLNEEPIKILETNIPFDFNIFLENLIADIQSSPVEFESKYLFPLVFTAISDKITSTLSLKYFFILFWHSSSVKSPFILNIFSISLISLRSIESIVPFLIFFAAYCDQLPGAAPTSIN